MLMISAATKTERNTVGADGMDAKAILERLQLLPHSISTLIERHDRITHSQIAHPLDMGQKEVMAGCHHGPRITILVFDIFRV